MTIEKEQGVKGQILQMEDICPKCGSAIDIKANRKLKVNPFLKLLGGAATSIKELRNFDNVQCPSCNSEFRTNKLKMFGIFPRRYFWVPFFILILSVVLMELYINHINK